MNQTYQLEFCYMLMQPYNPASNPGQSISPPVPKDAPYFYELDIDYCSLRSAVQRVDGTQVDIQIQVLNNQVWAAECRYRLTNSLGESALIQKRDICAELRRIFLAETKYKGPIVEEYTVLLISGLSVPVADFIQDNSTILAQLLRPSDRPLDAAQIENILQSRTSYSIDDLTIVDWEGALVISPRADFQTEIDLLKIGNYHLLKYRLVDELIDEQLQQLRVVVARPFSWFSHRRETFQKVVDNRLSLMLDFENTDQSILLIGDWYPAQLYRVIFDEFYIDDWKAIVSTKLENLSSIAEVVQQDLSLSWSRLLDIVQLVGWMVLLIGSILLFLKDVNVGR